jgi:glutamate-1-semialdehyde 2,1-aminomutase
MGSDEPAALRLFDKSARYHADAAQAIAGGVNSNIRLSGTRLCFTRAAGAHLFDVDGNTYIDYALGMGPAILGHAPPQVVAAVRDSLALGQMYAGQHPAELELARLVQRAVPSAELVRFGITGSEMVQAALRVARAYTGRTKIIKFEGHYHGWFDNVLANVGGPPSEPSESMPFHTSAQSRGQPPSSVVELLVLPWNSVGALRRCLAAHGPQVAGVLMEPMMCNSGAIVPRPDYLKAVRQLCDEHGVVLIFDEVITGFRLGLAGAQGRFGVEPDLSIFAKAIGAGFPLAMLTGRRKHMELIASGAVNHSGTYNANVPSIVAGVAALKLLSGSNGQVFAHIERLGHRLMSGLVDLARKHSLNLRVSGLGAVFNTAFTDETDVFDYGSFKRADDARLNAFLDGLLVRGVRPMSRGTWFLSAAHTDADVEETLASADQALDGLAAALGSSSAKRKTGPA